MDALIVVDVQNDFINRDAPLLVPGAIEIIEPINAFMEQFDGMLVATQDWHPQDHCSFKPKGPWPVHCVQGTYGADLHALLAEDWFDAIIRKGQNKDVDSYSGFMENDKKTHTGLYGYLSTKVTTRDRIFVCGLAKDYCVKWTAEDALVLCPSVYIIDSLTKMVDPSKEEELNDHFKKRGIKLV